MTPVLPSCSRPAPLSIRPTVSILMPVWNAAEFLPAAIESVLAQTTTAPWELLIADDGSTDTSPAIARRYAQQFPARIRFLQHAGSQNLGTSQTRNLALAQARGSVIAFLDADDVYLPDMLSHQLHLLARFPEAAMVYANAERTWEMHRPMLEGDRAQAPNELPPLLPRGARAGLLPPGQPLDWFLEEETLTPCTCTVLVHTEVVRAIGGFVEHVAGLYDDQAFYARIMLQHRVAVSTRCVARYRRHAESCCGQRWHDQPSQAAARKHFLDWLQQYRHTLRRGNTPALSAAD